MQIKFQRTNEPVYLGFTKKYNKTIPVWQINKPISGSKSYIYVAKGQTIDGENLCYVGMTESSGGFKVKVNGYIIHDKERPFNHKKGSNLDFILRTCVNITFEIRHVETGMSRKTEMEVIWELLDAGYTLTNDITYKTCR